MATETETSPLTNGYYNNSQELSQKHSEMNGVSKDKVVQNGIHSTESQYLNGPDQILPASEYTTIRPEGRVRLRVGISGLSSEQPVSVPGLLRRMSIRYPDHHAMASKGSDGQWHKITIKEYYNQVRTCAKAFLKLGLKRHHSVCILGFNSPQWFISDLATIHAGGFAAGIYTTNSAEACFYCLQSSRANICVVEDDKQLEKILSIRSRLPELKAIVQWDGQVNKETPNLYSWEKLMEIGSGESDTALDAVLKTIGVNECCTLVYTSGTVGQPKAVMLSHDNLTWDALSISDRVDLDTARETLVSYLPLSHVAAQVVDIYGSLMNAITVYFADKDALKGSLVNILQEVQPTKFLGVPRVWEKIYEKMMSIAASNGAVKNAISSWAKGKALAYNIDKINGVDSESLSFKLARWLVLKRIRAALGLGRCTFFVTAAAPLSPDIKRYFLSVDIPIMDGFGMSEAAGAHAINSPSMYSLESAGCLLNGVETMFADAPSPNGPGEICMRGRHVFMGYLNDQEKTADAIDRDGWLHSGDIGRIDTRNCLYITGRIKEILITAGGENVAPIVIEQTVKAELPFVSETMLIGDRRKFLSMLVTLRATADSDGTPLDTLDKDTIRWVASLGSSSTKVSEIIDGKDPLVTKAIHEGIVRANKNAISNAQKIQKFAILPRDFSIVTGELGPTMKLKRNVVHKKYEQIIENFYKD